MTQFPGPQNTKGTAAGGYIPIEAIDGGWPIKIDVQIVSAGERKKNSYLVEETGQEVFKRRRIGLGRNGI